ncbi:general transcription and DNA repair factor IIH helicase subunit XPB1, partial [Tanacetum coccineum]
ACADGRIFLGDFSPLYKQASDFLNAIAEPFLRAVSFMRLCMCVRGERCLETETIITDLNKLAKNKLPKEMVNFIHASTANYRKVLKRLLSDEVISRARVLNEGGDGFTFSRAIGETECTHDGLLNKTQLAATAESKEFHSFQIDPTQVENVKKRCLLNDLNHPLLEEYDFHNDYINPALEMELKPQAQPRPYQEESLSRMFRNGRARSGIIMLPCGAGKSLVGVSAACQIKKSSTLVREDENITDLNVLIGPKLYEANRVDLVRGGYIENVQCAEVRCLMTKEFFTEYLKKENFEKKKQV